MTEIRKRGRPATLGLHAGGGNAAAGLKGKAVLVPTSALAALTSLHGPGRYLHGQIKGKDTGHKDCVLVKCREDPRLFYFDVGQVQSWLEEQEQGGFFATVDADIPPGGKLKRERHGEEQGQQRKRVHVAPAGLEDASTLHPSHGGPGTCRQRPPIGPPKKGTTKKAEVADLTGKEVEVPGSVFNNHLPGLFFRAYIMGPDAAHASAVVLRMLDDPRSRFYFHASEVRDWMCMMNLRAQAEDDSEVDEQDTLDEALAARVLAHMSEGSSSPAPSPSSLTKVMPPASTSPQPPLCAHPGQHGQQGLAPRCASIPCTVPQPMLRWGPTELIAQCPSLLPPSLVQQLLGVSSLRDSTAAALGAAANQMESQVVQEGTADSGQQEHREKGWQAHRQQSRRRVGSSSGKSGS